MTARVAKRDQGDKKRLAYCRRLSGEALARLIFRDRRFTKQERKLILHSGFIYRFVYWVKTYRGRLSFGLLERLAGGRRLWSQIDTLLLTMRAFTVLDEYDEHQHKCRQWGVTEGVVKFIEEEKETYKRNVDEHEAATQACAVSPAFRLDTGRPGL